MSPAALLFILVSATSIPVGDTLGKLLMNAGAGPAFVAWSRFGLGALLVGGWLTLRGSFPDRAMLWDFRPWFRGALIACAMASIMTALRTEPMASVYGAFFLGPILSALLSALLLGERISVGRWALLCLGFAGVMMVVRPGFGMSPGLTMAVLAGVLYGCYLTASRWLGTSIAPQTLLLVQLLTGAVLLAPLGINALPPPTWAALILTIGSVLGSLIGNLFLILAYARAEASRLAPFVYFQLIAATGLGLAVFGDVPDYWSCIGLALLAISGFATISLKR